jgi:hypothetical protein
MNGTIQTEDVCAVSATTQPEPCSDALLCFDVCAVSATTQPEPCSDALLCFDVSKGKLGASRGNPSLGKHSSLEREPTTVPD